jgi:hypothetical protein
MTRGSRVVRRTEAVTTRFPSPAMNSTTWCSRAGAPRTIVPVSDRLEVYGLKSAGFPDWLIRGYLKSLTEFPIVLIVLPTRCNWISSNIIDQICSILTHCIDYPTDTL